MVPHNKIFRPFLLFVTLTTFCLSCSTLKKDIISVNYSTDIINDRWLKVTFWLTNNDSSNYYIPYIKPVNDYSNFSDKKSSNIIQGDIDVVYEVKNGILSREDLKEIGQMDSMYVDSKNDSIIFYFREPFMKEYYDEILNKLKDKKFVKYIYPSFYHAIDNGCVYLRKGETKGIVNYVYHYYPLDSNNLQVELSYRTKSILFRSCLKYLPKEIKDYKLFRGSIELKQ